MRISQNLEILKFLTILLIAHRSYQSNSTDVEYYDEATTLLDDIATASQNGTDLEQSVTEAPQIKNNGTYLVLAPSVIRPQWPYSVSVQILKSQEKKPKSVRVQIRNDQNETVAEKIEPNVHVKTTKIVTIDPIRVDKLPTANKYKLHVRGETADSKVIFEDEKELKLEGKHISTFIQTDKAIYKPSALVQYRVIVIKPDLVPYKGKVSVQILDPKGNMISQSEGNVLDRGVYSNSLQLASEPPLGDWKIVAQTDNGDKLQKAFTVEKYVLPKFEINVKAPTSITIDKDLTIFVSGKYTYGKGVTGKATISIDRLQPSHSYHYSRSRYSGAKTPIKKEYYAEKTVDLSESGETSVTFSKDELKNVDSFYNYYYSKSVEITAKIAESLTGIEREAKTKVTIYKETLKLAFVKEAPTFKPGFEYTAHLSLTQTDNTPIGKETPRKVQIKTEYSNRGTKILQSDGKGEEMKIVELDEQGLISFNVQPPLNCTTFTIRARYDKTGKDDFDKTVSTLYASLQVQADQSPSNTFMKVIPEQKSPYRVGESIWFVVNATRNIPDFSYQVMSGWQILKTGVFEMDSAIPPHRFQFEITKQMAPKSHLIVYHILPTTNEIVADYIELQIESDYNNKVSLSISKNETQPGENVTFMVNCDSNSLVSLLAIDQSVLLLKSGNDITNDLVKSEIEAYSKISTPHHYGGYDANGIIKKSGLIAMTDAYLYQTPRPAPTRYRHRPTGSARGGGRRGGSRGGTTAGRVLYSAPKPVPAATFAQAPEPEPVLRQTFPETWIFLNGTSTDGKAAFEETVPDTITSWVASAFAIHDDSGLGLAPATSNLRVFRPFFIHLNLPYSVKRGEKFAVQVLVFSYMNKEQNVVVSLKYDKDTGFDILNKDGSIVKRDASNNQITRNVVVPADTSRTVYFPIVPTQIGTVKLTVTAKGSQAGDAVEIPLKVEVSEISTFLPIKNFHNVQSEGYRTDRNEPVLIELYDKSPASKELTKIVNMEFPSDIVEGSKKASVQVIGDIMGPVLSSIGSLLQMPTGCGEQNMLLLVPNIVVLKYLKATNRKEKKLEEKALEHMKVGYQRELTYKRSDNSFSAFGNSDKHGSTWLTAFVVRSFAQAKPFIFIDQAVVNKSIDFLNTQQLMTGAFAEQGHIHHKAMQGGASDGGLALTAYVVVALLENGIRNDKAIEYLEKHLDDAKDDVYMMAVINYALTLANSDKRKDLAAQLQTKRNESDGMV
ncbi:hypothetical protein WR25_06818 isoform B [Diploscapter pachys]|uniref:TEP1-F n=1 Tax=Diploscapter pachys TaxID=2018661 RepID=A0A2A2LN16_9BILA|nr:hypothetical protein WR25_06818 isoform B [Diploscapter pachys]